MIKQLVPKKRIVRTLFLTKNSRNFKDRIPNCKGRHAVQTQANSNQFCYFISFVRPYFSARNIYCQIMQQISRTFHVLSRLFGDHGRPVVVSALTLCAPISRHKFSELISLHFLKHDIHCLQVAITTLKEGQEVIHILDLSLQITHQSQERLATPPGSMSLTLLEQWCGFSTSHKNQISESAVKTGSTAFHPYPRRLESLTVRTCHYKGIIFFLSYLKTLSVGLACERQTYFRSSLPSLRNIMSGFLGG